MSDQGKFQGKQPFSPVFPLQFNAQKNIYILTDNSFASKLIELSISNRVENHDKKQTYQWYLHPEETMYLISVGTYGQENEKIYRKQFIQQIYKNCQSEDIDMIHFYLSLRKRNKLCRRVDNFALMNSLSVVSQKLDYLKKSEHIKLVPNRIQLKKYKIFKVYNTSDDYKKDQNLNLFILTQTQQQISSILFDPDIQIIKQTLGIETLHVCIIENNDSVVIEVKQN